MPCHCFRGIMRCVLWADVSSGHCISLSCSRVAQFVLTTRVHHTGCRLLGIGLVAFSMVPYMSAFVTVAYLFSALLSNSGMACFERLPFTSVLKFKAGKSNAFFDYSFGLHFLPPAISRLHELPTLPCSFDEAFRVLLLSAAIDYTYRY